MKPRTPATLVALFTLLVAACGAVGAAPTSPPLPSSTQPERAVQVPSSSSHPAGSAAGRAAAPEPGRAGAVGLGDPYFPELGNGGYEVEHYDLALTLDMDGDELEARATLRVRALEPLASFSLDLYGLEVESVQVNGVAAGFERPPPSGEADRRGRLPKASELVVRPQEALAQGAGFEVEVRYSGSPEVRPDPSVGFLPGVGWDRKESGVYVVSECIGASSWFPCNDHPSDKATFAFEITVPRPYTAAANGLLVELREEDEQRTFVFRARDPMASYLATLNVAEFGVLEEVGPRGMPIRTYHPLDASAAELADFRRQGEVLEYLETKFGPYPFECIGAVIAYENIGGALECQTLPVYGRGCTLPVIVHEIAHQWFGNAVSPALWRDMWLNEGFASYAEWLWREREFGTPGYEGAAGNAYERLRQGKVGSPYDPGVTRVFGARVYTRGPMVLYGLRREVGDELFFRILSEWVATRRNGNGSTQDFIAHCARLAGRDLSAFFDEWLFSEVTPLQPQFESAPAGATADGG